VAEVLPFPPIPFEVPADVPAEVPAEPIRPKSSRPESSRPPDAEARAQALDIRRSFIVEAPAGSGKTGLLIQRFLKLLADQSVTAPEQVLAITFTNKATAEMRDRVLAHLANAAQSTATAQWSAEPAVLAQLAASAEADPAPSPNDFQAETRALAKAVLERDRQLGWSLLDQPRRLNIRTIDSVCAEIASALPVLSGSGGRLTPAADATPLHREAARRTLLLLGGGDRDFDQALRDLLLHRDGNLTECEALLADMLRLRDQWGSLIPVTPAQLDDAWLDAHVLPRLELALDRAICDALAQLAEAFPAGILADLATLAAEMARSNGHHGKPSQIAACKGREQPPGVAAEDLEHWLSLVHLLLKSSKPRDWRRSVTGSILGFEIEAHHKPWLKDIIARLAGTPGLIGNLRRIDSLPPARYPADQWAVAKSLFRVLSRALVELQFVFAARNQCDFTELSLLARYALDQESGPDDLAAALGARLQHLLVDEMQDTSTGQYDLIQLLTEAWDGHSQTVFLVGDPRQSIYLFRQARVERFVRAMRTQRLGELPLTRLRLTANFRSQRDLVDPFNRDFALIFPGQNATDADPNALPYTPAHPTLPASPDAGGVVWHANPLPGASSFAVSSQRVGYPRDPRTASPPDSAESRRPADAPTPAQIRKQQAQRDAAEIRLIARRWLLKPLPAGRTKPWQIAVLVRGRNHLDEIVAEFDTGKRGRIPYRAVEITPLSQRQEVLDLIALTRALLHPADRVAALALLRAPWCGLPLADLHTLAGSDDPALKGHSIQRLMNERGHLLPDESCQRMARVWTVLQAAAAQRARLTTAQLVERAWRSLGGDAWLSPPELTNAHRFFQLLDALEAAPESGRLGVPLLEQRLQGLYAEPQVFPPEAPFVELLTIHKAKGLEWDVVILPGLERKPASDRSRILAWSEIDSPEPHHSPNPPHEDPAHFMLAPIAGRGEESKALNNWLNRIHRAREAAERKRLFYVACTRAREELHLFASPEISAKGEIIPRHDSLLHAAWPAAQPHFANAPGEPLVLDLAAAEPASNAHLLSSHGTPLLSSRTPSLWKGQGSASLPPAAPPSTDERAATRPSLQRLPLTFDPAARFAAARARKLPYAEPEAAADLGGALFSRPEGSFAARSFGNAVHAFLEILAGRVAAGHAPVELLGELPSWTPRIAGILRADGLPPATVDRLARDTRAALENSLRDPDGLWLLAPHPGAASELALTAWQGSREPARPTPSQPASIRIDRVFHAGTEPHSPGKDCLWIVDYKTSTHGLSGLDDFLAAQRATYAPQLEAYARILTHPEASPQPAPGPAAPAHTPAPREVRLALYYPAIPRLIWWKFATVC